MQRCTNRCVRDGCRYLINSKERISTNRTSGLMFPLKHIVETSLELIKRCMFTAIQLGNRREVKEAKLGEHERCFVSLASSERAPPPNKAAQTFVLSVMFMEHVANVEKMLTFLITEWLCGFFVFGVKCIWAAGDTRLSISKEKKIFHQILCETCDDILFSLL